MGTKEFHNRLRELLHREPFIPFAVEFCDGTKLPIKQTPVVFADGVASFIDPVDGALVDFSHDEVMGFSDLQMEAHV